jgi:transcriptional regulator with XRE-family HTH domain
MIYPGINSTMPSAPGKAVNPRSSLSARTQSLGDFLRAHRERLSPEDSGIPSGSRRRTPGLRREEVAQLCGVSSTWYTWIEQGRPVSASPEAMAQIAVALRLSRAERAYLFELSNLHDPDAGTSSQTEIPTSLSSLLRTLKMPAYVLDRQWNAVAWNRAAEQLFVDWLTKNGDRNLLRYIFLSPTSRRLVVDWEMRVRRVVAEFRADSGRYLHDQPTRALIADLSTHSNHFRKFWNSQDVYEREGGPRQFQHPQKGLLRFDQITMKLSANEDLKLVVLTPDSKPHANRGRRQNK